MSHLYGPQMVLESCLAYFTLYSFLDMRLKFRKHCQERSKSTFTRQWRQCCLSIAALAILLPEQTAATIVGDLGVAFVMMLNASPLVAIKTVIDEKSADSIPLSFTLASIACCFFWSIVGIEQLHDWVVYFPNMMGLCFGLVQLGLKLMYSNVDDETFACSQGSLASKEIAM